MIPYLNPSISSQNNIVRPFSIQQKYLLKVRLNNKLQTVNFNEIAYLESDANYTLFVFKNGRKSISAFTLKHFINKAENLTSFFRINRRIYLNLTLIKSIETNEVLLKNGERFLVSRRRMKELVEAMQA